MKCFRSLEHPSRVGEDTGFLKRRSQTTALARDWAKNDTRRKPIHTIANHQALLCLTFRSRARCRVYADRIAQIARSLHSQGSDSCIMVMCFSGRSWYRSLWVKKTRERNKEPDLSQANASWAPWAHGCLEGRRREGAILVQQRCQWSAASAGVTSVFRLHDATNANLSMKHDVAKQAANEMARKETTFWRDQAYGQETFRCLAHLRECNVLSLSARTGVSAEETEATCASR